jgi:protein copG
VPNTSPTPYKPYSPKAFQLSKKINKSPTNRQHFIFFSKKVSKLLHLMRSCVTIDLSKKGKFKRNLFMKKRLTITLSESVLDNLEQMAKELGLSKSAMISISLENFKKKGLEA